MPATADTPCRHAHAGRAAQCSGQSLAREEGRVQSRQWLAIRLHVASALGLKQAVEQPQVSLVRPAGCSKRRPPTPVALLKQPQREKAGQQVKRLYESNDDEAVPSEQESQQPEGRRVTWGARGGNTGLIPHILPWPPLRLAEVLQHQREWFHRQPRGPIGWVKRPSQSLRPTCCSAATNC